MGAKADDKESGKLVFAAMLIVILVGCLVYTFWPRNRLDILPLVPFSGRITVEGEPLDRGSVHFLPNGGRPGKHQYTSTGEIQPDGSFTVDTYGRPGIPVGECRIMVIASRNEIPRSPGPDFKPDWLVHEKYTKRTTTDLYVEVTDPPTDKAQSFDMER